MNERLIVLYQSLFLPTNCFLNYLSCCIHWNKIDNVLDQTPSYSSLFIFHLHYHLFLPAIHSISFFIRFFRFPFHPFFTSTFNFFVTQQCPYSLNTKGFKASRHEAWDMKRRSKNVDRLSEFITSQSLIASLN